AEAEDDVARGEGLAEDVNEHLIVVASIPRPGQLQSPVGQQVDHPRQMLVLPFAGQDLVADDDGAEADLVCHRISDTAAIAGNDATSDRKWRLPARGTPRNAGRKAALRCAPLAENDLRPGEIKLPIELGAPVAAKMVSQQRERHDARQPAAAVGRDQLLELDPVFGLQLAPQAPE